MTVDKEKMHNHFCFMHFHAQNMQKSMLKKSGYAEFVLTVPRTMPLEWVQMHMLQLPKVVE
jgi:hypothetical protein